MQHTTSHTTAVVYNLLALTHTTILWPSWILSRTTWVSRHQKGKINLDLLEQETVNGSDMSWAICKPAPWPRRTTTPASHHSVFYRPDAFPAAKPTASKHWRLTINDISLLVSSGTNCLNLFHPIQILASTAASAFPFTFKMSPKKQNLSTNFRFALSNTVQ